MTEVKEKTQEEAAKAAPTKQVKKEDFNINLEEMVKAGLHLGHRSSKTHPKMKQYIYGARNDVNIIDLEKTRHLQLSRGGYGEKAG